MSGKDCKGDQDSPGRDSKRVLSEYKSTASQARHVRLQWRDSKGKDTGDPVLN